MSGPRHARPAVGLWALALAGASCHPAAPEPVQTPSDAPVTDTPETGDSPGPSAGCEGALLCEDFESQALNQPPQAPWRDETGSSGASVTIDDARAFSGSRSVHVSAPKGQAYRRGYFAIHGAPVFPAASREMFGRLMVWLDAAPVTPDGAPPVHWTLLQGEGRSESGQYNAIYRYGGQHRGGVGLMANYETTPPTRSDCWQHSKSELPVKRWACVEWHFVGEKNEMELWLDGQPVEDAHVVDRASGPDSGCMHGEDLNGRWLAPPAFQSLYLGWERYQQPEDDRHVWIDDVAVSKTRIGCPKPAR